jgi:hypothetical protein
MSFAVFKNGRYFGVVETNEAFARPYWAERSRATGERFSLHAVPPGWAPSPYGDRVKDIPKGA